MNKEIKIRPEQENDFQAVREVVELAFRDVEDSDQSEPYLVERLRKTVVPKYQRIGVGSALIREAHKRAGELGYKSAVLLGHKDYYPRFGYKRAIDFGIEFPFDVPSEYCMVVELAPEGLKNVHGMIKYAKPFME